MPSDDATIEQVGDFIQQRALGALARHWLNLDEADRISAMNHYHTQSSAREIEQMATALLHIAAGYPDLDVRRELVRTYAFFMRSVNLGGKL